MHQHFGIQPVCNVIKHKRVDNHHSLPHRSTSLVPPYSFICIFHSIRGATEASPREVMARYEVRWHKTSTHIKGIYFPNLTSVIPKPNKIWRYNICTKCNSHPKRVIFYHDGLNKLFNWECRTRIPFCVCNAAFISSNFGMVRSEMRGWLALVNSTQD